MLETLANTELVGLGILFLCAILGGIIANKFKQPAVFGLLLVGALIGPSALNLVQDERVISAMAEFGAILILFIVGFEFDISKMIKMGVRTLLIGLLKFAIMFFIGFEAALLLGFSTGAALFIGVILSFSGTIVIINVLKQKEMIHRREVPLLISILIIEDILAIFMLIFFSGISSSELSILTTLEKTLFALSVLVLTYLLLMKFLNKAVMLILKNNKDDAVYTYLSLGVGTLLSYFASVLGLTPAAGAFLAGSLIASLPNSKEYGRAIHPYALIFTSIFFLSMGTMVSFEAVKENAFYILAFLLTIVIGKFIAVGLVTYILANFRREQPFFASIAMVSIGEFSLLIANESQKFGVGVDLVSITAALIFISALMMSSGINLGNALYDSTKNSFPINIKSRLNKLSEYLKRLFDQLEIESHFTKRLNSESRIFSTMVLVGIILFFLFRRTTLFFEAAIVKYLLYALGIALLFMVLYFIYKKLKAIMAVTAVISTHIDNSITQKKCKIILNSLFVSLILIFAATLFPFAIFLLKLGRLSNLVPFTALLVAWYLIKNATGLIESYERYPKYSPTLASPAKV